MSFCALNHAFSLPCMHCIKVLEKDTHFHGLWDKWNVFQVGYNKINEVKTKKKEKRGAKENKINTSKVTQTKGVRKVTREIFLEKNS